MKVYVAGRTSQRARVRHMQWLLTERGHEITFDWTGAEGEIRPDIEPSDLELRRHDDKIINADTLEERELQPRYCEITHLPTGTKVNGRGTSDLKATEDAMSKLRGLLGNKMWREDPEVACKLAERERKACDDADAIVLIHEQNILGAAVEFGMVAAQRKPAVVVNPEIRESVFWYLPEVKLADSLEDAAWFVDRFAAGDRIIRMPTQMTDRDPGYYD